MLNMDPLSIARQRVHDFELEIEKKISTLSDIEKQIINVGQLRMQWLKSVSTVDSVETETFRNKLEILKLRGEIGAVKLQIYNHRVAGTIETQTLRYLVEATKPYDDGEKQDSRANKLKDIAVENLEELRQCLHQNVSNAQQITNLNYELINECESARMEYEQHRELVVDELNERISQYSERLTEATQQAQKQQKKVTGEYLVLRHNARVARDILLRGQKEAHHAREVLQERLDALVTESHLQREKMEKASEAELKILTDDVRSEVVEKEREVEAVRNRTNEIKALQNSVCKDIKKGIKKYVDKYNALQIKRQTELKNVSEELKVLRGMIVDVELKLNAKQIEAMVDQEWLENVPLASKILSNLPNTHQELGFNLKSDFSNSQKRLGLVNNRRPLSAKF